MAGFSIDLRQRVADAYAAGEVSRQQIADRFRVGYSWVRKILRWWDKGSIGPLPHGDGHTAILDGEPSRRLRETVTAGCDATLSQAH